MPSRGSDREPAPGLPLQRHRRASWPSRTTIRQENRKNWRARRASRRSSNVGPLARAFRTPRRARWKRRPLRAIRLPGAQREPRTFQRRCPPGAHGPVASRPGSRARAAGRLPSRPIPASGAEVREYDLEHTDTAVARTASAGAGVLRVPLSLCRLRRTVRSHQCRQSGTRGPSSSGRRGTGVRRPACAGLRLKATLSAAPALHGHGNLSHRHLNTLVRGQGTLAFTLPDLEAGAMKSDRLRSYARRKVNVVRRLRGGNALAAPTARTPAGVFAQAAPQLTVRQESLPQSPTDGEYRCSMVHEALLARAGTAIVERMPHLAPSPWGAQCAIRMGKMAT